MTTMRIRPLFRSVGADDRVYLFVIEGHARWTIRRDGTVIATGPTDEDGIIEAIATFRAARHDGEELRVHVVATASAPRQPAARSAARCQSRRPSQRQPAQ